MTISLIVYAFGLAGYFRPRAYPAGAPAEMVPLIIWGGLTILGVVFYMIVAWRKSSEPWYWRWEKQRKTR